MVSLKTNFHCIHMFEFCECLEIVLSFHFFEKEIIHKLIENSIYKAILCKIDQIRI